MTLLAAFTRPGPSTNLTRFLPSQNFIECRRYKSEHVKDNQVAASKAGYLLKRKGDERKKITNKKKLPIYQPLPIAQLNHQLFKTAAPILEVPEFQPKNLHETADVIGQPFVISPPGHDPMRVFGLPRNLWLEFKLLSKPYTVVRQVTKDTLDLMAEAKKLPSSENRIVLTGRPGCGKSFLLLQVVEHCVRDNWIVIYIPRGIDLINSISNYYYDIRTQTYLQPWYSFRTLDRMYTVNKEAFDRIELPEDLVLEKQVLKQGTKLTAVVEAMVAEKQRSIAQAPLMLDAVMKALEDQKQYSVLLAIDDFQTLYGKTAYRDPHFVPIHSYHLSLPRMIMEYASGKRSFRKGAIIGAISGSQTSHPLPLELREALDLHTVDMRPVSPYEKRNKTMLGYAAGLRSLPVPEQLSLEEAAGIFNVWKDNEVFGRKKFTYDEFFLGKYTESGGNARDFVRNGLIGTLDA